MKIKFLGHSCFYIEKNDFKALIDPFISDNPVCPVTVNDFKQLNYIFVTHGHKSHLGDAVELAKNTGATIVTNLEICHYLKQQGVKTYSMYTGARVEFDFGTVKMTPALHGSSIETDSGLLNGGTAGGFLIYIEGKKLYHAGDTGLSMEMKLLEFEHIDLALLPIGGNFTMDIIDAANSVDFIKPKKIIPMHYNTFPLLERDPKKLREIIDTEIDVIIMNPGDDYEL